MPVAQVRVYRPPPPTAHRRELGPRAQFAAVRLCPTLLRDSCSSALPMDAVHRCPRMRVTSIKDHTLSTFSYFSEARILTECISIPQGFLCARNATCRVARTQAGRDIVSHCADGHRVWLTPLCTRALPDLIFSARCAASDAATLEVHKIISGTDGNGYGLGVTAERGSTSLSFVYARTIYVFRDYRMTTNK